MCSCTCAIKKNKNGAPMKYVVVAGGTLSGIGKGITLSSIGLILKSAGMRVIPVKIDPYLNKSCGTISPIDHGEVFVLEDGCEADMDLGFYERVMDVLCGEMSCITGGKVYRRMIAKESAGAYFGETMEVVPHVNAVVEEMINDCVRVGYDGGECMVRSVLERNERMDDEGRAKKMRTNNAVMKGTVPGCDTDNNARADCDTDSSLDNDRKVNVDGSIFTTDQQCVLHKEISDKNFNKQINDGINNAMHKKKAYKSINTDNVVVLIEVGGVIDDTESSIFSSTLSHIKRKCAEEDFLVVSVDYMPSFSNNEQKTKLVQRSVQKFISRDLKPGIIVCRGPHAFFKGTRNKIVSKTGVNNVFSSKDTSLVYEIPFDLQAQGMRKALLSLLKIKDKNVFKIEEKLSWVHNDRKRSLTVGMVIKYNGNDDSYVSVIETLKVCALMMNIDVHIKMIDSEMIEIEGSTAPNGDITAVLNKIFCGCDCMLVPGGFGTRGTEGKILAINYARTNKIPFLGICLGFQLCVVEFCRNVLGLCDATSEEFDTTSLCKVIMVMEDHRIEKIVSGKMRLGSRRSYLVDSMVKDAYGANYKRTYLYCDGQECCNYSGGRCSDEYVNTGSASSSECTAASDGPADGSCGSVRCTGSDGCGESTRCRPDECNSDGCRSSESDRSSAYDRSVRESVGCAQPASKCPAFAQRHDSEGTVINCSSQSSTVQPNNKSNDYNGNNSCDSSHHIVERHRHRYEVNPLYVDMIERKGLRFVGKSKDGLKMDIFELNNHPFFVGVQYHPEMTLNLDDGHPLFRYFLEKALQNKNN